MLDLMDPPSRFSRKKPWREFWLAHCHGGGAAVPIFLVILCLFSLNGVGDRALAAQVSCINTMEKLPAEKMAAKWWPSGFRPTVDMCTQVYLHGEIAKGDYEKVRAIYHNYYKTILSIYLESFGGDVQEAIKIGRLLHAYLQTAVAPLAVGGDIEVSNLAHSVGDKVVTLCSGLPNCVCASACALVWYGGVERGGTVGLHRPTINDPAFKVMTPADAEKAYRSVLGDISRYMTDMEVPRPMIDAMVATGSADIKWMSSGYDERTPSYAEWADASCGSFTIEEQKRLIDLETKKDFDGLNNEENMFLDLLIDKMSRNTLCKRDLRISKIDLLSPP